MKQEAEPVERNEINSSSHECSELTQVKDGSQRAGLRTSLPCSMPRIPNAQLHYERKRGYSANQMIELGPERVREKEQHFHRTLQEKGMGVGMEDFILYPSWPLFFPTRRMSQF